MTARIRTMLAVSACFAAACATNPDKQTLRDLHSVDPDLAEVEVDETLDEAMDAYERYLAESPESAMTPEALRRLADLKLEKEYGYLGASTTGSQPAPERSAPPSSPLAAAGGPAPAAPAGPLATGAEMPAAGAEATLAEASAPAEALPGGALTVGAGPAEAIALYDRILARYPDYPHNDWVLYQKARAYDELGRSDEAIEVVERLIARYPYSQYIDEAQFRRAEYFFVRKRFLDAEEAYGAIVKMGPSSDYYELALYKLGWTLYKQELHEEALHQYIALLDHKVETGYDFDQTDDESDERRIADTYRVISLSFSSLGGAVAVTDYFARFGERGYENRIYRKLAEYYLEKLRYSDSAKTYEAFVELKPLHADSPGFSMRVIEVYDAGGFPRLVLESKKDFAARYGLEADYWQHFDPADAPEVLVDLKANLGDLANHYHALYQDEEALPEEKPAHYDEALRWYREYIASFNADEGTPAMHYQMADLMLENESFQGAAVEYETTAYTYEPHEQAPAAGYAAIYAWREAEKRTPEEARPAVTRSAVDSTLRFVQQFPDHENAAVVLSSAARDLYEMGELAFARSTAKGLVDRYDDAELPVRREAWATIAHASFDLEEFSEAEKAYERVLDLTGEDDEGRAAVVDSLAASIYKQGEAQVELGDDRAAAKHFLRVAEAAPTSEIRPVAEYDAGAAYVRLEAWKDAGRVFEAFRESHPDHDLASEATKQIAVVYREQGDSARAADEYERVAAEADDPALRAEALLVAGEHHEKAEVWDRALAVYELYVTEFSEPLETAVETRFKVAELHEKAGDEPARRKQLARIVEIEKQAGDARTPRIRVLAGRSALVLSEDQYDEFAAIELTQPFAKSLKKKKRKMEEAIATFDALIDYETADVTAAATYYMARVYFEFSRSLIESERPTGLTPGQLLEYEDVLEEEAFPFEERAIAVHEKNLELLAAGIYNGWVEKSLSRLADLMPGRYAKFEMSTGLLGSATTFAYQRPGAAAAPTAPAPAPVVEEEPDGPVPAAPADLGGEVDSARIDVRDLAKGRA